MIELGEHAGFIVTAYAISALAIAGMIALRLIAARRVRARIAALEAELGIER
jgi:heme exporter protein CcmD